MTMRSIFLAIIVLAVAVTAAKPALAVSGRVQFEIGGQARSAIVVEPERFKRSPRTVVIVLHGANNGSARRVQSNLGLDEAVRGAGVVVVYPEAVNGRWNVTGEAGPDDAAFLRALADRLIASRIADPRRIFLMGTSTGGMLALRIACSGADYLAGVGALIAAMPVKFASNCKPAPMAALLMNGTANPLVPFAGGTAQLDNYKDDVVSADASLMPFAQANHCKPQRQRQDLADRDRADGSRVVVEYGVDCARLLELVRVEGGGHTLPGRPARADRGQVVGAQNRDVNISRLIADFVRRAEK
jgi:polyhydroxybutyrate depolymerase